MGSQAHSSTRARRYLIVAGICLSLIAAMGYAFLKVRKPLKRVQGYSAKSVTSGQTAVTAEVFKPWSMNHLLYIKRPDAIKTLYEWFVVDLNRNLVFVPGNVAPRIMGIPFVNPNQAVGIELTQPKLDDNWTVTFNDDTIEFYNSTTKVTVLKTAP